MAKEQVSKSETRVGEIGDLCSKINVSVEWRIQEEFHWLKGEVINETTSIIKTELAGVNNEFDMKIQACNSRVQEMEKN